ncbi:MAG TPA: AAA family ATPase [Candidatus Methylomirabilis sp.]|jgi:proteasome regulatory subunit|nr:AAA family ATPase [Candidatus Methylomirabilis sp.]
MPSPKSSRAALPDVTIRRLEDLLATLAKRFGDLRGKVDMDPRPGVTLQEIGGLAAAKREIQSLVFGLRQPDLHKRWGTVPAKGVFLYGPPGTGKTLLARALAHEAEAVFYHLRIRHIAFKWYGDSGDLIQEVFQALGGNGRCVLYLDEIEALSFDRMFPGEEARAASRRVITVVLERLEALAGMEETLAVASTNRPDAVDPSLVGPGRFARLIEVPLPDGDEKREILALHQRRAEAAAGRPLFQNVDYDAILARTVKLSGGDLAEIVQRALEEKARCEGAGEQPGPVETDDILRVIEDYRRIKEVVEKIRYGQYL